EPSSRKSFAEYSFHREELIVRGRALGCHSTHNASTDGRVSDEKADIDTERAIGGLQVLGEGPPLETDTGIDCAAWDRLDAREKSGEKVLIALRDGCEREPAVPGHHGGEAVLRRRSAVGIPEHLCVVVGVKIYEARRHD